MLGLLVILVVSWGLLYFIESEHIDALGIIPTKERMIQFIVGFSIICMFMLVNGFIETYLKDIKWKINPINFSTLWNAFMYHLKSALTEDLVFRGALLYILIKRIGVRKAIFISTLVFGIYHWFSYGILGERWILLLYVFTITGANGFIWAYIFHKTKSIMLGLGLHVGVNFAMSCFIKSQPFGEILFTRISETELTGWSDFFYSFFKGLFPATMTMICFQMYLIKNQKKIHF